MGLPVVDVFIAKATVVVWAYAYNDSDALIDPTAIMVTIKDPEGDKVVDGEAMTQKKTGVYYYYYRTAEDAAKGIYTGEVLVTDGVGELAINTPVAFSFKIK